MRISRGPFRRHPRLAALVSCALLLSGIPACVSRSKYDDLSRQLRDRESLLEQERAAMQRALAEYEERNAAADRRIAEYRELMRRFRSLIDSGKLRIKIVDGRMVVELPSDILFASAQAHLSREGREAIEEITAVLIDVPDRRYQVEGHTDDWPIQTVRFRSNWELAAARAITVVQTMVTAGLPPERVSAASFGETRPVGDNETEIGRAQNRRIEIVIVPDLADLPGFEELQEIQNENDARN
jgi:chemotaxis protein MotB